jgi:hypothetical protein
MTHARKTINSKERIMNRTPVSSSNIASIGYDSRTHTLEVEFNNGSVYHGVPADIYQGLMGAPSHGEYLDVYVKKGGYAYTRIL